MNKIKLMIVLLASLVLGACSSDSDSSNGNGNGNGNESKAYTETTVSAAPVWAIDWTNNQERPNWTEPIGSNYENSTILNQTTSMSCHFLLHTDPQKYGMPKRVPMCYKLIAVTT